MKDTDPSAQVEAKPEEPGEAKSERPVYFCDRCGFEMVEVHCKVVCPNCGARWDCSDLSIYTD